MARVTDIITDTYKNWTPSKNYLIATQTGSGKTFFVIHSLLINAVRENKFLVFVCNRTTLYRQTLRTLDEIFTECFPDPIIRATYEKHFIVVTYQHMEKAQTFPDINVEYSELIYDQYLDQNSSAPIHKYETTKKDGHTEQKLHISQTKIKYYVFDEAHYFIQDANFNLNINYWDAKKFTPYSTRPWIGVFLTATPEPLQLFLKYGSLAPTSLSDIIFDLQKKSEKLQEALQQCIPDTPVIESGYLYNPGEFHTPTQREKNLLIKQHAIYEDLYAAMKEAFVLRSSPELEITHALPSYDYVDAYYFKHFTDLYEKIKETTDQNEKWLIFVNSEEMGEKYYTTLCEMNISACFLSSKRVKKKKSLEFKVFETLCSSSSFKQSVMISTSLLDNGVNIKDPSVRHIVIEHTSKTTFLQMLGRRRILPQDHTAKINLYLKAIPNHTINGYRNTATQQVNLAIPFLLKSYRKYTEIVPNSHPSETGLLDFSILYDYGVTDQKVRSALTNLKNQHNIEKMLCINYYGHGHNKELFSIKLNIPYFLYCLYEKYYYDNAFLHHSTEEYIYLAEQLSWIGKTYNPSNWVNNNALIQIAEYLKSSVSKPPLLDDEREIFKKNCYLYLQSMCVVPQILRKDISRYKGCNKLPGMKKLNDLFLALNLPYEIISNTKNKMRKTQWIIRENALRLHLSQLVESKSTLSPADIIYGCIDLVHSYHGISGKTIENLRTSQSDYAMVRLFNNEFLPYFKNTYYLAYPSSSGSCTLLDNKVIPHLASHINHVYKDRKEIVSLYTSFQENILDHPLLPEKLYEELIHSSIDDYMDCKKLNEIFQVLRLPYHMSTIFPTSAQNNYSYKLTHTYLDILLNSMVNQYDTSEEKSQMLIQNCIRELLLYSELDQDSKQELFQLSESGARKAPYTFDDTYIIAKIFDRLYLHFDFGFLNEEKNHIYLISLDDIDFINRHKHFIAPPRKQQTSITTIRNSDFCHGKRIYYSS